LVVRNGVGPRHAIGKGAKKMKERPGRQAQTGRGKGN